VNQFREHRAAQLVVEARSEDAVFDFVGRAAVFHQRTWIGGYDFGFVEEVAPSAFDRSLTDQDHDVVFVFNHDTSLLLARRSNDTLRLSTDAGGLLVEASLADTTVGRDLRVLLERGDIDGMSFAFSVRADRWSRLPEDDPQFPGQELRTILDVDLWDVSPVTMPAYAGTSAGLRAMDEAEVRALLEARPTKPPASRQRSTASARRWLSLTKSLIGD